jgi:hypothetical protein
MNRKQFIILLTVVVVVGAAGLLLNQRRQSSWQSPGGGLGQKLLGADFPINDVAHIALRQGAAELNLVKQDAVWRVRERKNYPANFAQISEFLLKAADLKIVQSETVAPSQLSKLGLAAGPGSNAALVVEFNDRSDKPLKTLLLGKKHLRKPNRSTPSPMGDMDDQGWPDGRYVKVGADSGAYALISEPLANIEPKPEQWLDKAFFSIDKVRGISVSYPVATNSWKLTRDTESGDWKLSDAKPGEQLDASKTSGLANPLVSPSFNDIDVVSSPGQSGPEKPTVITLDTFDNFTYALTLGQKTNDNIPLRLTVAAQLPKDRAPGKDEKPEDKAKFDKEFKDHQKKLEEKLAQEKTFENWTYLVSNWTLDPLLKERAQLLVEQKAEPKNNEKTSTSSATNTPSPAEPLTATNAPPQE